MHSVALEEVITVITVITRQVSFQDEVPDEAI